MAAKSGRMAWVVRARGESFITCVSGAGETEMKPVAAAPLRVASTQLKNFTACTGWNGYSLPAFGGTDRETWTARAVDKWAVRVPL